jgi:transcriptional regulator GlxA family with amidase domain
VHAGPPRHAAVVPKRIAMLAYPGAQILDVTGPLEVFARTTRLLRDEGRRSRDGYSVEIVGLTRGPFPTSSGLLLHADHAFANVGRGIDTLLVAGGMSMGDYLADSSLLRWLRKQATHVRRLASVCTGAFFLAEAGLLAGKRATTHWASCAELARRYPDVRVEPDRLFVKEGSVYTAAGVTAGIDLALALVEEDHGREVALGVARVLVMFLKRPGGQAQFSAQLAEQLAAHEPVRELQTFILDHPHADLSVEALARRAGMSPRNFARIFARDVGTTPARFVSRARVEAARRLLEESSKSLEDIAAASGLGSPESVRRAFVRTLGVGPRAYRTRFNPQPLGRKERGRRAS